MRSTALRCGRAAPRRPSLVAVAALLGGGAASAQAGPGVTLKQGVNSPTKLISGGQIAGAADSERDVHAARAPRRSRASRSRCSGLSIRGLLRLAGFNPGAVKFVQVVGGDGSVITVTDPEINSPPSPEAADRHRRRGDDALRQAGAGGGTSERGERAGHAARDDRRGRLAAVGARERVADDGQGRPDRDVPRERALRAAGRVASRTPGTSTTATSGTGATVTHTYKVSGDLHRRASRCAGSGGSTAAVRVGLRGHRRPSR